MSIQSFHKTFKLTKKHEKAIKKLMKQKIKKETPFNSRLATPEELEKAFETLTKNKKENKY